MATLSKASGPVEAFFAYPTRKPTLAESIRYATKELNKSNDIRVHLWEDSRIGGKMVIEEICADIDRCPLFFADLTGINPNVLFELGFAIARKKRVWLIHDVSYTEHKKEFDQLGILTTVGYRPCLSAQNIVAAFYQDQPHTDVTKTLYSQAIEPALSPHEAGTVLYLKSNLPTDASIKITRRIELSPCKVTVDDPKESTRNNLGWYGKQAYQNEAVICHLADPKRDGARLIVARYALACGLAYGFGRKLIILTEDDFLAPLDYRDLQKKYSNAPEAVQRIEEFIAPVEATAKSTAGWKPGARAGLSLTGELRGLRLGEHIAENERLKVVEEYFVDTVQYTKALEGTSAVFVGRKGSGKTANLLKLEQELASDARNLVCVIKPAAYEIQGVVRLLTRYKDNDTKGYALESLWKYLILTEIAKLFAARIGQRSSASWDEHEAEFMGYLASHRDTISEEFAVRLERSIDALLRSQDGTVDASIAQARVAVSESLHQGILGELRKTMIALFRKTRRVAILVDNLDKAWDQAQDLKPLSEVLLALIGSVDRFADEIRREIGKSADIVVSLAVFIRSDIFDRVKESAREPDKIAHQRIEWRDSELLLRVIEQRYVSSRGKGAVPDDFWKKYVCQRVNGIPTRQFILLSILPRPRDLIFLVNEALANAVNRGHSEIQEEDIKDALREYSHYALDSIVVESPFTMAGAEDVLLLFAGRSCTLSEREIGELLPAQLKPHLSEIIDTLCKLNFLGPEIESGKFSYPDDSSEFKATLIRARRLPKSQTEGFRFEIHRAFRPFLEISSS